MQEQLIIKANELEGLLKYIDTIPTGVGMPIKLFFLEIQRKREEEAKLTPENEG